MKKSVILASVAGGGVLVGILAGLYWPQGSANSDDPDWCDETTVLESQASCTNGSWTDWNMTDEPIIEGGYEIPAHARLYIGTKTYGTYSDCGDSLSTSVCTERQKDTDAPINESETTNVPATCEDC